MVNDDTLSQTSKTASNPPPNYLLPQFYLIPNYQINYTLENVFRKLKARNRTHAVSKAFTLGILTTQLLTYIKNCFKVDGWNLYDILEEDKI